MGRVCFAPNCTSGQVNNPVKVSMFKGPRDNERLEKWRTLIPRGDRLFAAKDILCEKHFEERFIQTQWTAVTKTGEKILDVPRGKKTLTTDAIPTLFPGCPKYLSRSSPPKRKRILRKLCNSESSKTRKKASESPANEETVENDASVTTDTNCFSHLWKHIDEVKVPNRNWATHAIRFEGSQKIVINEMILHGEQRMPVSRKQVVIDECLGARITVFQVPLPLTNFMKCAFSYEVLEVNKLLRTFDQSNVCAGGPCANARPGCSLKCATVDSLGKWRHKMCSVKILPPKTSCCFCRVLETAFHLQKRRPLNSKRRNKLNLEKK